MAWGLHFQVCCEVTPFILSMSVQISREDSPLLPWRFYRLTKARMLGSLPSEGLGERCFLATYGILSWYVSPFQSVSLQSLLALSFPYKANGIWKYWSVAFYLISSFWLHLQKNWLSNEFIFTGVGVGENRQMSEWERTILVCLKYDMTY